MRINSESFRVIEVNKLMRQLNFLDKLIAEFDQSLRTVHATPPSTGRDDPAGSEQVTSELSEQEKQLSGRLMRINHAGEVAAQGLYRGQGLTAKQADVKQQMQQSAAEENDHLLWCENRIKQLDMQVSYFSPLWYWGSFSIGAVAGLVGDKWSLGFVKETEDQVIRHLDEHLVRIPSKDQPSIAVLQQMKEDEAHHGDIAVKAGAAKLPWMVRKVLMPINANVMTKVSYWV